MLSFKDTWLYEMFAYIWAKFYTIPSKTYNNFTITDQIAENVRFILFSVFFGIVLGFLIALPLRKNTAKFVQSLMNNNCYDVKSAKTLYELGFFTSYFIRKRLEKGNVLRLVVYSVSHPYVKREEDDVSIDKSKKKQKIDNATEENTELAEKSAEIRKNFADLSEKTEQVSVLLGEENNAENPAENVGENATQTSENKPEKTDSGEKNEQVSVLLGEENSAENVGEDATENQVQTSENTPEKTDAGEKNEKDNKKPFSLKDFFLGAKNPSDKIDFETERFYIPEDLKFRAEMRFSIPKVRWWLLPAVILGAFLFIGLCLTFAPTLLQLFDNLLTMTIG